MTGVGGALHRSIDCPHCEELRAEVAWLKSELALEAEAADISALRPLGLTPGEARLVLAMHARKGRVVPRLTLEEILPEIHGHERTSSNVVSVLICRIRKAIGEGSVHTAWGAGYGLTPEGMALVDAALEPVRARARERVA